MNPVDRRMQKRIRGLAALLVFLLLCTMGGIVSMADGTTKEQAGFTQRFDVPLCGLPDDASIPR